MKLGTKPLWRIHATDVAPWFFDVGPDGRFNLAESGTCYLAEEPIGAIVEKFGRLLRPGGAIPEPLIALFGSDKPPRSAAKTTAVPVDLIHEAAATFAITVLPRRHSRRR